MDDSQRNARTAALAQQIWEAEGRPDGQAARHWKMAQRLVQADLDAQRVQPAAVQENDTADMDQQQEERALGTS